MKIIVALACGLALPASPLLAQAAPPSVAKPPPKTLRIEAEVAPSWVSNDPFDYGQRTDSTLASLTLTATPKVSDAVTVKLTAGPSATLDDDSDLPDRPTSSLNVGAELGIPATNGISTFGSVGYKRTFKDFFAEENGSERTYSAGLRYEYDIRRFPANNLVSGTAAFGVTDASDDSSDQTFAQLKGGFSTPLWWWAAFDVEGTAVRRWFKNADVEAGVKERRTEWSGSIGFNIARLIVGLRGDPDNPWLRKLKVGFIHFRRESNIAAKNKETSSPSLSFSVGRDF